MQKSSVFFFLALAMLMVAMVNFADAKATGKHKYSVKMPIGLHSPIVSEDVSRDVSNPGTDKITINVTNPGHVIPREGKGVLLNQDGNFTGFPNPQPKLMLACGYYSLAVGDSPYLLKSEGYPDNYPKGEDCSWTFQAVGSCLSMVCARVIVKRSDDCQLSYLLVSSSASIEGEKLCGRNFDYVRTTARAGDSLTINFVSDEVLDAAKGFKCTISANECPATAPTVATTTKPTTTNSDCLSCGTVNRATRIVGGQETEKNEYPWQVALAYSGTKTVFCGGSLYNEYYVFTAAHCGDAMVSYQIETDALFGAHDVNNNEQQRRHVSQVIIHPDYNSVNLYNDIALLRLADKVTLNDQVKPACFPNPDKDYSQANAIVSGWGATSEGGSTSNVLQEVEVPVISNSECAESYGSYVTENTICAGLPEGGKDSCQGDSGGPMATQDGDKWVLLGIVSWGHGCARPNYPGVYVRIAKYIDWIKASCVGGTLCTDGNSGGQQTTSPATTKATTTVYSPPCKCGVPNGPSRIVGGGETLTHEYPWQAALIAYGGSQPFCGASIISVTWVLTAAHCLPGMTTSNSQVLIGEHNWSTGSETARTQKFDIAEIVQHDSYSSSTMDNDMGLIKVASTISFSDKISPVCLPTTDDVFDQVDAIVSGWGTLSAGGSQPEVLNDVIVPTMLNSVCQVPYSQYAYITDNMICAGLSEGGKDSCQGDSGGPMMTLTEDGSHLIQIGVVSFGYGCAKPGYPGVYARVSKYNNWIKDHIKDSETCSPPV